MIFLNVQFCNSQDLFPKSLSRGTRLDVIQYDTLEHLPKEHYEKLIEILFNEYNIKIDSLYLLLIFIDDTTETKIGKYSPGYQSDQGYWDGLFVVPATIILSKESDAIFFHELFHYLVFRKLIFQNVPQEKVHNVIYICEDLMLFSKGYIDYVKTLK